VREKYRWLVADKPSEQACIVGLPSVSEETKFLPLHPLLNRTQLEGCTAPAGVYCRYEHETVKGALDTSHWVGCCLRT
jgi:hypothetical protein